MAIQTKYPSIRPTLDLNFAASQTVDPRITFSRPGTGNVASYFDSKGVMRFAPPNTPRIDFDPVTGECKGLLIEEQRTNLLTYSEQFESAAWVKLGTTTATPNISAAPDGTMTADTLAVVTAVDSFYQNTSVTGNATYTGTLYFHTSSTATNMSIQGFFLGSAVQNAGFVTFNPSTGAFISATDSSKYTLTSVGGGWFRVSYVFVGTDAANTSLRFQIYNSTANSNLVAWGAQLEVGAFPTSYIKTEASQVTRAADLPFMIGTSFSDWYRQDEGTFVVSATSPRAASEALIAANDNTNNNAINVYATPVNVQTQVKSANVEQALFAFTPTGQTLVALAYKANDFAASVNGSAVQTDVSATVPAVTQLRIGGLGAGGVALNGHIRRIAYYPKRLTNEQLQALSA